MTELIIKGIGILVLIYGFLQIGLLYILAPRSRHELSVGGWIFGFLAALFLAITILPKDTAEAWQSLLTSDPDKFFCGLLAFILLNAFKSYRYLRLFKNREEASALDINIKNTGLSFAMKRIITSVDRKLYIIRYGFKAHDGQMYKGKKWVVGGDLSLLKIVLYDKNHPSHNILVPSMGQDRVKY